MDFGSNRKRRWYRAVVGSVAGATGLAAVSVLAGATPFQGLDRPAGPQSAHRQVDNGPDAASNESTGPRARASTKVSGLRYGGDPDSPYAKDGTEEDSEYGSDQAANGYDKTEVPCDPDELIAALVHANADGGDELELTEGCTYTLTSSELGDGLPTIVRPVSIHGNGATIVRAANADRFRIFHVGVGGNLTLHGLTVKGGDALDDGGALLVDDGGRASVEHSKLAFNRAGDDGGAIANFGITKVADGASDKDGKEDGKDDTGDMKYDEEDGKEGSEEDGQSGDQWWSGDEWGKDKTYEASTEITDNTAVDDGGAIYNAGALTVKNARLSYNSAGDKGGAILNDGGVARLTKVEVDHNFSRDQGGAVYTDEDGITKLVHSYVHDNTSGGNNAGGLFSNGSQLFLSYTTVRRNTSENDGAGVFNNGGELTAEHSKINENTTFGRGGAIYNNGGEVALRSTELDKNKAVGTGSVAGGLFNNSGLVDLTDSKVTENSSTNAPGGIRNNGGTVDVDDDSVIIKNRPTNCDPSNPAVENCFG